MRKWMLACFVGFVSFLAFAEGTVVVKSVEAQQRYPWNGLVDIVVSLECPADDVGAVRCSFVATNSATGAAVPITSIIRNGSDTGSGTTWMRRYIWNATNDVGAFKRNDLALTVDASLGVQLWENGPYWAECNVGASKPEEYGCYFWWGDTVGYKRNADNSGWISVKDGSGFSFSEGNCPTYGKNNSQLQSEGYIDATGNLVAAHDVATAHLGAPWRMPTDAEFSALISNCDMTWIRTNGVEGLLFTGKGAYASKGIFFPFAGGGLDSAIGYAGDFGHYWSSTPNSGFSINKFRNNVCEYLSDYYQFDYRYNGRSVRPLRGFAKGSDSEFMARGVTTHLKLDCRTGVRACSAEGEVLRYDASWCEGGSGCRITDNGTVVATGSAGTCTWRPTSDSSSLQHLLKLEILSEGQVVGTETAQFAFGYVRDVTARQLWPHNKVALSFTVADDIGEVKGAEEDLSVWCVRGIWTNAATRILGDRSAKPGIHRIVWDMEAEGLRFANSETTFGVSVEEVSTSGVQLWENGPYWAECNVGATKPEEYGYYFWWGDTVGYKRNVGNSGWVSVKDGSGFSFSSGNCPTHGKSNSQLQSDGYIDSTGNLVAAHDAATAHLGAPWRMPTDAEIKALISNCDITWVVRNGVEGWLVTGKGAYAAKSIFLPAAGYGSDSYRDFPGSLGDYWSSTPYTYTVYYSDSLAYYYAWYLRFKSGDIYRVYDGRVFGRSVRPLRGFAK